MESVEFVFFIIGMFIIFIALMGLNGDIGIPILIWTIGIITMFLGPDIYSKYLNEPLPPVENTIQVGELSKNKLVEETVKSSSMDFAVGVDGVITVTFDPHVFNELINKRLPVVGNTIQVAKLTKNELAEEIAKYIEAQENIDPQVMGKYLRENFIVEEQD